MKEREYDMIHNEGGEGYNPYRAKREKDEWAATQEEIRQDDLTPQGKIDALYRRIELECGSVAREWGNVETIDALQGDLHSQIKKIKDEMNTEFLSIWTPTETTERRTEWNTRVKAGEFGKIGGKHVDFRAMRDQEERQGWDLEDLKKAIKLNNL